jgi:transposase
MVQQQALRDYGQSMDMFYGGSCGKPSWRKAKRNEGFRIVGARGSVRHCCWDVRRLSRHVGEVRIPKVGWVRFRWSRAVPDARSYRITMDRAGRWHVAFAAIPSPVPGPGTGEVVGVDRGVTISAALSTGEMLTAPRLSPARQRRHIRLQRRLEHAKRGSNSRAKIRLRLARLRTRDRCARRDWAEKTSTDIARRFDLIRIEDLHVEDMTRKSAPRPDPVRPGAFLSNRASARAGLNREIRASGWGLLAQRLEEKAPGRVEKINPAYTSQTCNACGHCEPGNRESQAFLCKHCGHTDHADVNAAKNIAAGHAVTARGGFRVAGPLNREPRAA